MTNKKEQKLLVKIHKDIDRKFDSIEHINIQNFSINGVAVYNDSKCFFKIVDEKFFIKEMNGYLISYKKIPTMEIIFTKKLFNCKKYLIAYTFDNNVKKSTGLLNDILVKNDLNNKFLKSDICQIEKVLNAYNNVYSNEKKYYSYCPSNIFFCDRIQTRLKKWYMNSKKINDLVICYDGEEFEIAKILNEIYEFYENNMNKKRECILSQGDPNTLNISTKPCFFDLATAGYNSIIGEVAITLISTLIYDNYFCPKYHPKSYFLHEKAIEQYVVFKPSLIYKKHKNIINISSNILTSQIRKNYILNYLKMLKNNDIGIDKDIKYYILMRLLCVFDIRKMDNLDYYYSLFLVVYFYKKITNNFYKDIEMIINEMECAVI